jgi:hypothetical protein
VCARRRRPSTSAPPAARPSKSTHKPSLRFGVVRVLLVKLGVSGDKQLLLLSRLDFMVLVQTQVTCDLFVGDHGERPCVVGENKRKRDG